MAVKKPTSPAKKVSRTPVAKVTVARAPKSEPARKAVSEPVPKRVSKYPAAKEMKKIPQPPLKKGAKSQVPQGGLPRAHSRKSTPLLPAVGSPGGGSRTRAPKKVVRKAVLRTGAGSTIAGVARSILVPTKRGIIGRYLFVPTDLIYLMWRGARFAWRERLRVAIVSIVAIVAWTVLGAGVEGTVFLAFLAALFAWDLDGRVGIGAGLSCLVLIAVMQALIQGGVLLLFEESTERVAVWAYYFLCIGVLKQLADLVRAGRTKSV